jgi:hypothetical protein
MIARHEPVFLNIKKVQAVISSALSLAPQAYPGSTTPEAIPSLSKRLRQLQPSRAYATAALSRELMRSRLSRCSPPLFARWKPSPTTPAGGSAHGRAPRSRTLDSVDHALLLAVGDRSFNA